MYLKSISKANGTPSEIHLEPNVSEYDDEKKNFLMSIFNLSVHKMTTSPKWTMKRSQKWGAFLSLRAKLKQQS